MDFPTYIPLAISTESPQFNEIDRNMLAADMDGFMAAGRQLDQIKKALFYGKGLDHCQPRNRSATLQLDRQQQRLLHAIIGIATEAGELVEALFNVLYDGKALDRVNLVEELGDLNWYQAIAMDAMNMDPGEVLDRNIAKLRARYPDRFSTEKATQRDLSAERLVLAE